MTEIIKNLYIGNDKTARDEKWIRKHNIKLIVNCTYELPNYFIKKIPHLKYIKLELHDNIYEKIKEACIFSYGYIEKALKKGDAVLIHCYAGISRSSTVMIYYMVRHSNKELNCIWTYVKNIYPKAKPNINYRAQLRALCQDMLPRKTSYEICWTF